MPINIGREMALPMEQIIGGPLQAVIKAQTMAAAETAAFINNVGLVDDGTGKLTAQTVEFSFTRKVPAESDDDPPVDEIQEETVHLNVPLLTIVPVPFIRVEEATIDFECKVSSSTLEASKHKAGVAAEVKGGVWGVSISVKASYSYEKVRRDQVDRSATMKVHVKAVQDDMPAGLGRILDILETAVNDSDAVAA